MRTVPRQSTASAIGGLWFVFWHDDHQIALWASSLTGKEELFLNGKKISTSRKIRFRTSHVFEIGGSNYTVELRSVSMREGEFKCELIRDGRKVGAFSTKYVRDKSPVRAAISWALIAGLMLAAFRDVMPWWQVVLALVALTAILSYWPGNESGYIIHEREV